MEDPPGDDAPAADAEASRRGEELRASDEALAFMSSIVPAELQRCVFPDHLETVSEGGRSLGKFSVTVKFAHRLQQACVMLHAQSQGAIDESPCGTTVTTYLTTDLEVLEEEYHEYVKLESHGLDKRCHMVQRDGQMVIEKVTAVGEEVARENVSYPISILKGLVTEGSNLLLMRLMALKKTVPERLTFISLDQGINIIHTTYTELGLKQIENDGETKDIFGIERTVHMEDSPTTWHSHFLPDGHLVSRVQVGSPVVMRPLQLPSQQEAGFEKIPLVWEEDIQMCSKFLDRKEELKSDHASYLRQHPEIRALISDFLQFLLLRKPDDVFQFARDYFLPFAPPPEQS